MTGAVNGFGPHHFIISEGTDHISQTRETGALSSRVITRFMKKNKEIKIMDFVEDTLQEHQGGGSRLFRSRVNTERHLSIYRERSEQSAASPSFLSSPAWTFLKF